MNVSELFTLSNWIESLWWFYTIGGTRSALDPAKGVRNVPILISFMVIKEAERLDVA